MCIKLTWSTWAMLMDDQRSRLMADRSSRRWPDDDRLRLLCGRSALDGVRSEISMWPDDAVAGRRSQRWPEDGPDGSRTTAVPTVAGRHSRRWPFGDIDVSVRRGGRRTLATVAGRRSRRWPFGGLDVAGRHSRRWLGDASDMMMAGQSSRATMATVLEMTGRSAKMQEVLQLGVRAWRV